ncbi:MAG: NAD-dependent epimerase/dehydratase family protein [Bacteroidota bacterium]
MMKALIIGGSGFLGNYLVEELLKNNISVRVLSRTRRQDWDLQKIDFIQGNIEVREDVNRAVKGMDWVFLVAAKAGVWGSYQSYYHTNVKGAEYVIDASIAYEVSRLVYTSTPSVVTLNKPIRNGDESLPIPERFLNAYQKTKSIAEKRVLSATNDKLQTVAIRPQAIWGDGDRHVLPGILKKVQSGSLSVVGDGTTITSVSYVRNVAWAHFLAATCEKKIGGNVYFINDEEPVKLWDWLQEYSNSIDLHFSLKKKVSSKVVYALAGILEFFYKISFRKTAPPLTRYGIAKVSNDFYFSIEKAKRDLGYYERYDLEDGKVHFKKYLNQLFNIKK